MSSEDRHEITAAQADVDPDLLARRAPSGSRSIRHARQRILLAIAVGGALGTPCRYAIGRIIHVAPNSFPWSTFTVNVSGSFALGLLLTFVIERWPPSRYVRPFAAIGFLGAYTTFSTYAVETDLLVKGGQGGVAALYVIASVLAGLSAVYAGIFVGRLWPTRRGATP